jgi:HD-GYP domain-containing protein (c-di-GMP phosphodiesterase class II)
MPTRATPVIRAIDATVQVLVLAAALALAVICSRAADWHPPGLAILILCLTLAGDRLTIAVRSHNLSAAFVPYVLAMTLLGPAPAVANAVAACLVDAVARRLPARAVLNNLMTHAVFVLAGALLTRWWIGDVHLVPVNAIAPLKFGVVIFAVFVLTNVLNFALIALEHRILLGQSIVAQTRNLLAPMLPGQIVAAGLTAVLGVAAHKFGLSVLILVAAVLALFQYLAAALVRSEERADELAAKNVRLATLQFGVLTALMETLNLRDPHAARHAAAVARYARDLAAHLLLPEREQEIAHTAGLMHDIGRFAFPDRMLYTGELASEDRAAVRRHPRDGAAIVGRLDGYGPVAEIVLYHHEHFDGTGYPAQLIAREIPLLSRIVAVCETYDVLTARHSYRSPLTPHDAFAEMRRVSGRQLDGELVEAFISMLENDGPVTSALGDTADFAAELDFERRALALAAPSVV